MFLHKFVNLVKLIKLIIIIAHSRNLMKYESKFSFLYVITIIKINITACTNIQNNTPIHLTG